MILETEWHPYEILRRLQLQLGSLVEDQDFRYPELRNRLNLELSLRWKRLQPEAPAELLEKFIRQSEHFAERISGIEIWILMEWNERYCHLNSLLEIRDSLLSLQKLPEGALKDRLNNRLLALHKLLLGHSLSDDPSWWDLLLHRFQWRPFQEEIRYFHLLIEESLPK